MNQHEEKWKHFTKLELDVIYSALADYRDKTKHEPTAGDNSTVADLIIFSLLWAIN